MMTIGYRRRRRGRPRRCRVWCAANVPTLCLPVLLLIGVVLLAERSRGEVRTVSRVYHSACLEEGQSYWDYDNFQLSSVDWETPDRYEVTRRLGYGRFSEVLEAVTVDEPRRKVVLKVLKPARFYKIKREIRVLQVLAGGRNVIALEGACRDRAMGTTTLVLEHLGDGVQWFGHTRAPGTPGDAPVLVASKASVPAAADAAAIGRTEAGRTEVGQPLPVLLPPEYQGAGEARDRGADASAPAIGHNHWLGSAGTSSSSSSSSSTISSSSAGVASVAHGDATVHTGSIGKYEDLHEGKAGGVAGGVGEGTAGETRPEETSSAEVKGDGGGQGVADARVDKGRLTDYEVRLYLYKLLQALDFAHSRGLMHRDVKPKNVVINRRTRQLRLIDWGLGDFYIPGRRNLVRVGSRYYKAPELLLGFRFYDYAVDIFSVGCMLAGFLLNREPFFRGKDNEDQLVRIALVLGTEDLHHFLRKYDVKLEPRLLDMLGTHRKKAWTALAGAGAGGGGDGDGSDGASAACSPEALDLLDRMLCYDHQDRISAGEALSHAFFDPVREEADKLDSVS